jgi:hypothetical protein
MELIHYYCPATFTKNLLMRIGISTDDENYVQHTDTTVTIRETYTDTMGCECVADSVFPREFATAKAERIELMEKYAAEVNQALADTRAMTCAVNG